MQSRPLRIALARAVNRMESIRPQPHDIPMDFVITEEGVHEVTESGLCAVEPGEIASRLRWKETGARQ
jgi:hypothetical protein